MSEYLDPTSPTNYLAFQIVAVPIVALFFLRAVIRVARRERPRWGWFFAAILWFAAGIAILRPEVTNELAEILGIGRGADLLLYLLTIAFLASFFYFYQRYRRLESELTQVVRELAIRDAEACTGGPARSIDQDRAEGRLDESP